MKKIFGTISVLYLFLTTCPNSALNAQERWSVEAYTVSAISDKGSLPFWFAANKYGIVDPESANQLVGFRIKENLLPSKTFDVAFGADGIARLSEKELFFFNELYGEVSAGFIRLSAGKKKWESGIFSSNLSLGSMVWSGNAATMPQVMLSVPEYTPVPFTHNYLAFRGYIGHGWLGDDRFVKGAYLHDKALYLRIFPEDSWFNGHAGLVHNVQWGGTHPTLGALPSGFRDYLRIFTGRAGEAEASPGGEVANALGNTVGAFNFRMDISLNNVEITAYRQFFIETSVSTRFRSPWDGQWGLELDFGESGSGWVNSLLWEHVNTKQQNAQPGETIGADRYYYNFIYRNGWSYKGRIIGLPLVSLGPVNGREEVVNNIILAHNMGIQGNLPIQISDNPLGYELQATYSRSYGRTSNCGGDFCAEGDPNPLRTGRMDQWYNRLKLKAALNRQVSIYSSIGLDFGDLKDDLGLLFGINYKVL